jgi:hypothetical protein
VIRRLFWLVLGAAGGIMGYRRLAALGRRMSGRGNGGTAGRNVAHDAIRATRGVQGFSRDVREGMEMYSARRSRAIGPTLPQDTNDVTVNEKDDR